MIIRNATVLSFPDQSRRSGVDVRITKGRIREIGKDLTVNGEELIDASGMYLIPGLVNLHCHTAMTLLRGAAEDVNAERWFNDNVWIYERNLQPEAERYDLLVSREDCRGSFER